MQYLKNKNILITGVCGTIGSALLDAIVKNKNISPDMIVGIDINENKIFHLDNKFSSNKKVRIILSDIKDSETLTQIMKDIDIVFHVAALKHVIMSEFSPIEAVKNNIHGVNNIIYAAVLNKVKKVIFTSSDKSVNPTNVMGTSKLMGEKLITAANINNGTSKTIFASTRFGNVMGSSGSVFHIFKNQILENKRVTITDKKMTRFVMSIDDSVNMILKTGSIAKGGEVFITKMKCIKILDLAEVMLRDLKKIKKTKNLKSNILEIGPKPGEKLYEELMSDEEATRSIELDEFFCILPAFRQDYKKIDYSYKKVLKNKIKNPYNSSNEKHMSKSQISMFLSKSKLL